LIYPQRKNDTDTTYEPEDETTARDYNNVAILKTKY
jgi:hypothetical protein